MPQFGITAWNHRISQSRTRAMTAHIPKSTSFGSDGSWPALSPSVALAASSRLRSFAPR